MKYVIYILIIILFTKCSFFGSDSFNELDVESVNRYKIPRGLSKLYFLNKDTGFLFGRKNVLFKTIDGGVNWTKIDFDCDYCGFNNDIEFSNYKNGYLGCAGYLYQISDTSTTWAKIEIDTFKSESVFNDIKFIGKDSCFAIEACEKKNYILKTFNNGRSWNRTKIPFRVFSIGFSDKLVSYVGGHDGVLKSTDCWKTYSIISNKSFKDITVIDDTTLIGSSRKRIYVSKDSGKNWQEIRNFIPVGLHIAEDFSSLTKIVKYDKFYFLFLHTGKDKLFKMDIKGRLFAYELGKGKYIDFQILDEYNIYILDELGYLLKVKI